MNYINLTPHVIRLNDGREFPVSGKVARVATEHTEFVGDICSATFGKIENLPDPVEGMVFITSGMVAQAAKRPDVVAPATGHPDARRENGQIVSVPGFVRG